jgi:phosphoribosylformylglycinamidine synthase subunit PurL
VYERPLAPPSWLPGLHDDAPTFDPVPEHLGECFARVLGSPNVASKRWVFEQYDSLVQGNTLAGPGGDAALVRIEGSLRALAVSTDGNGRYGFLDPYLGGAHAVAEAARNVACTGARPVAATNCLNFGSPERAEIMGQFRDTVDGMADACQVLGTPVTGGNVSFYNQTGELAVHPTPVVGVLGVIDDVTRRTSMAFREEGQLIYLLGDTHEEFGGSAWAQVVHDHLGGLPPRVDLARERLLAEILVAASRDGMIDAAHDLSDGGLIQAVTESCLKGGRGARLVTPDGLSPFTFLFSESAGRAVLAVPRGEETRFTDMCGARGMPATRIGVVDGDAIEVQDAFRRYFIPDSMRIVVVGPRQALLAAEIGAGNVRFHGRLLPDVAFRALPHHRVQVRNVVAPVRFVAQVGTVERHVRVQAGPRQRRIASRHAPQEASTRVHAVRVHQVGHGDDQLLPGDGVVVPEESEVPAEAGS